MWLALQGSDMQAQGACSNQKQKHSKNEAVKGYLDARQGNGAKEEGGDAANHTRRGCSKESPDLQSAHHINNLKSAAC